MYIFNQMSIITQTDDYHHDILVVSSVYPLDNSPQTTSRTQTLRGHNSQEGWQPVECRRHPRSTHVHQRCPHMVTYVRQDIGRRM